MVEVKDIKDWDSLRAWLETQPQKTAVAIAYRAAMRVNSVNLRWGETLEFTDINKLPVYAELRCNLVSGVAAACNTFEIQEKIKLAAAHASAAADEYATNAAAYAANAVAYDKLNACSSANRAVATADAVLDAAALEALINDAAFSTPLAHTQDTAMWNEVRSDCFGLDSGGGLSAAKLWQAGNNPFAYNWNTVKKQLEADPLGWSFWMKWYEAALSGEPLNWEMLERIALIPSEDWEQGPAHLNGLIAAIEVEFELKARIAELEGKLLQISSSGRGIGDNQGPPMADEPVAKEILVIWEPLQALKEEIDQKTPSRNRLLVIAKAIGKWAVAISKWVANKADLAVNTAVKVGSTAAVGWAAVRLSTEAELVASMLSKISELATKLAGYFP